MCSSPILPHVCCFVSWFIMFGLNTQALVDRHPVLVDQHKVLVDQHPGFGESTPGFSGSTPGFAGSTPGSETASLTRQCFLSLSCSASLNKLEMSSLHIFFISQSHTHKIRACICLRTHPRSKPHARTGMCKQPQECSGFHPTERSYCRHARFYWTDVSLEQKRN